MKKILAMLRSPIAFRLIALAVALYAATAAVGRTGSLLDGLHALFMFSAVYLLGVNSVAAKAKK